MMVEETWVKPSKPPTFRRRAVNPSHILSKFKLDHDWESNLGSRGESQVCYNPSYGGPTNIIIPLAKFIANMGLYV